jgi:hypothetical protein
MLFDGMGLVVSISLSGTLFLGNSITVFIDRPRATLVPSLRGKFSMRYGGRPEWRKQVLHLYDSPQTLIPLFTFQAVDNIWLGDFRLSISALPAGDAFSRRASAPRRKNRPRKRHA